MTRNLRTKVITFVLLLLALVARIGLRGFGDSITENLQVQIGWLLLKAAVALSFELCSLGRLGLL